jgi:ssRNA-specific RNase YbeY (16S rRNA maturation enzyme)
MFQYNLVQHPSFSLDNKIIDSIFLSCSNIVSKNQEGCLNIVFVDEDSIQKLNKDFRNKDVSTDVLSFHYHEDFSSLQATDIA